MAFDASSAVSATATKASQGASIKAQSSRQTFFFMNVLRAYAAIMIVIFHAHSISRSMGQGPTAVGLGADTTAPIWWYSVVDLFFVMSGFLMVHMSRGLYGNWHGVRTFAAKRAARTPPLYWLYTCITAVLFLFVANPEKAGRVTASRVVASLLFYPVDGGPIIPLGWTLNAEVFFYIVFGVCVALPFAAGTAATCAILCVAVAVGRVFTPETYALRFWTDPLFLDFVWGVALAVIYHSGFRLSAFVCRLLVLVSAVPLAFVGQPFQYGDMSRPFTFGMSGALLVAAATLSGTDWNAPGPIAKGFNALANSAYSLYLTHIISLKLVEFIYRKSGLAAYGPMPFLFGGVATSLVIGYIAYLVLEAPLGRFLRSKIAVA